MARSLVTLDQVNGNVQGTCVVCCLPTDTALAFEGGPVWHAALLHACGVPLTEAVDVVGGLLGPLDKPDWFQQEYAVCIGCAEDAGKRMPGGLPRPTLPGEPTRLLIEDRGRGSYGSGRGIH